VVLHGEPLALAEALRDRIWRKFIAKEELPHYQERHQVISTRRLAGRTLIHVDADARPDPSFEPVEPDLEDVYFRAIRGHEAAA